MLPKFVQHEITLVHTNKNGEVQSSFTYKGQPCPVIDFSSNVGIHCSGLQLIIKDLDLVINTLKVATATLHQTLKNSLDYRFDLHNRDHIVLWATYSSALITYAKCFTKANGRKIKLSDSDFNLFEARAGRPTLLELHNRAMNLRHEWIAHGGTNNNERGKTLALLDPNDIDSREPTLFFHSVHRSIPTPDEIESLQTLTMAARDIALVKLRKKEKDLYRIEMEPKKFQEWLSTAKLYVKFEIV